MTSRTPSEAVHKFREPLKKVLSIVTRFVPDVSGGYHVSDEPHAVTLNGGARVRLSGEGRIHLTFNHYYRIVEDDRLARRWRVITTGYLYSFDDANFQEIIAFHWHPDRRSTISDPHLHLGPGAQIGYERLHRAHIPTGHIAIQDVLLLAINDLGVEPLIDRETALQTLVETRAR